MACLDIAVVSEGDPKTEVEGVIASPFSFRGNEMRDVLMFTEVQRLQRMLEVRRGTPEAALSSPVATLELSL